jgi:FlaA1/EpsC-like NDP-sugar epimerase
VQAGAIGGPGEVLVLQMGEPVKIAEVAQRLASLSPQPVPIEFTGLRPGEKLHEELFGDGEVAQPSEHALITAVCAPPLEPSEVRNIDPTVATPQLVAILEDLCIAMQIDQEDWDAAIAEGGIPA